MTYVPRITVRSSIKSDTKVVLVNQGTLSELISTLKSKFEIDDDDCILHNQHNGQIDCLDLIRDGDVLYLSKRENIAIPNAGIQLDAHRSMQTAEALPSARQSDASKQAKNWIALNVGGRRFVTTRNTLVAKEPTSMFARMFAQSGDDVNGRQDAWLNSMDEDGAYLIDRSPEYFEPILNYLRHGQLILNKHINVRGVLEEAVFYGITSIVSELEMLVQEHQKADDTTAITRREFVMSLMTTPTNCELRCQGLNFAGADLSKLDLRHVNFKYANLRHVNLSGANLSYCNFERSDLCGATLDGATLLGVKMLCTQLDGASLRSCNFEDPAGCRANMEGASMKNVNLEGSRMASVNLRVATLRNSNLQNCDLRGAVLAGADLENCDMSGCDLQEANLRGANLKGVAFEMMLNPLHMSQTVK